MYGILGAWSSGATVETDVDDTYFRLLLTDDVSRIDEGLTLLNALGDTEDDGSFIVGG